MKAANGGVSPAGKFGCTYCHNRTTATSKMKGVLSEFSGLRSQHPIGRKFTGTSAYTDTQGEYLSSITTNTAEEMDCLDCHEETLVNNYYGSKSMYHIDPIPAGNPYMLKNVTTAGEYDDLCRSCHGTDAGAHRLEIQRQGHPPHLPQGRHGMRRTPSPRRTARCCSRATPARTGRPIP